MNIFRKFQSSNVKANGNATEESHDIVNNFRDVQPLNNRKVRK